MYQRLNEEMEEADCKCYTGRLSRLVNVLNGYYDDIKINISDSEQISNIILTIKNKYEEINDEVKKEMIKELKERGYEDDVIQVWIDNV